MPLAPVLSFGAVAATPDEFAFALARVLATLDPTTGPAVSLVVNLVVPPLEPIKVSTAQAAQLTGLCAKSRLASACPRVWWGSKTLWKPAELRAYLGSLQHDPNGADR